MAFFTFKDLREKAKAALKSLLTLGAKPESKFSRQAAALKQQFGDTIRLATFRQTPINTVLTGIRNFMKTAVRHAQTEILTTANAVANQVRQRIVESNPGEFQGYVHVSVLDTRTSDICIARSGIKWDLSRKPVGHSKPFALPPLHPRCRSKMVPWVRGASIPEIETYPVWLKKQPKSVQVDALGPGRWELWQRKDLSLRQLIDQSNRPLTLEELRRKV